MNNYTNPVTVKGNPASFEASGNGKLLSLSVPFSPIQDLHGYANPWPGGGGVNKLAPASIGKVNDSGITVTLTATELNGYAATKAEVTGTAESWGWRLYQVGIRDIVQPSTAYRLTFIANAQYDIRWNLCSLSSQHTLSGNKAFTCTSIGNGLYQYSCEFTTVAADNDGWNYTNQVISFYSNPATLTPVTITIINNFCLTLQSDPEGWFPYSNICPISGRTGLSVYVGPTTAQADATTYSVDWTSEAGTVYGGTLDVVTGVLTVDRANIASYNGEVINEPWLSSMDEYAPGATPTTGAQVVYKLATPITYQLTPQEIEALVGENNVWSDSNEAVTLTYVIELFTRYTFIVNGNDYTGLVERDSYRTAVTPVYGETIQTLDGVGHTALLRVKGSLTVKLNPQTAAQTAAICADLLNAPCEVQYKCLQRNVNVTALMVLDAVSAMFLSRCLYLGQKWNDVDEIVLKEL